jgi:hypothetical protein
MKRLGSRGEHKRLGRERPLTSYPQRHVSGGSSGQSINEEQFGALSAAQTGDLQRVARCAFGQGGAGRRSSVSLTACEGVE